MNSLAQRESIAGERKKNVFGVVDSSTHIEKLTIKRLPDPTFHNF